MSRRWLWVGTGLIVVATAGILVARRERRPQPNPISSPAVPITDVNFVGTVEPRTTVAVGAPAAGVLDSYFVDVGQQVFQGQLLGKLRNDQVDDAQKKAQAELDQAQDRITNLNSELMTAKLEMSRATAEEVRAHSNIDRLEKEYLRQKKFWDQQITPRLTYEKAQQDYLAAKSDADNQDAALAQAKDRLAQLTSQVDAANRQIAEANETLDHLKTETAGSELHSPADGLVVARRGQPGDAVDSSVRDLFTIATDLSSLDVDATPDAEILARIHPGQAVSIRVPELSPDEIRGVVREVRGPQIVIDFMSPAPLAKPDLPAQVRIKF